MSNILNHSKRPSAYSQQPILYSNYASDTSWRVRIALAWKGIEYETRYIDMDAGEHVSCVAHKAIKSILISNSYVVIRRICTA